MNPFFRSAVRILVTVAFLLLVAWVCLKTMQGGMDLESLARKGEGILRKLGGSLEKLNEDVIQPVWRSIGPKLDDLAQQARSIVGQ